ncbi:PaaI family thioesterase [Cognatishimia sp. SS12]|uniref:PaaI family thioesterase n=1 Tax=Cognatishimia sp. SS12 TaxID=2979465 RepID=UPI00232CE4E8|nr:PaaI family thioesterase [Cognatishimia sp. SS12]MDC0736700.1 PaaI family thioesterase [Cognatishimia sp. SS12]
MSDERDAFGEARSALQSHLGYNLTAWSAGQAEVQLPLAPYLMNRAGIPHGGIYATLLDTAMGYAGCYTGDETQKTYALTVSMTVNFLARPTGKRLIARAQETGGGRSLFFAEAQITDENGTEIARGSGAFKRKTAL